MAYSDPNIVGVGKNMDYPDPRKACFGKAIA